MASRRRKFIRAGWGWSATGASPSFLLLRGGVFFLLLRDAASKIILRYV